MAGEAPGPLSDGAGMKTSTRTIVPLLAVMALHSGMGAPTSAAQSAPTIVPAPATTVAPDSARPASDLPGPSSATVSRESSPEAPPVPAPGELTVFGGTDDQRAAVDRAVDHFDRAGLELPGIVIRIHTTDAGCDGYDGAFRAAEWRVDVCNPHWMIVLHELAHVWERATLTDETRHDFMELRHLSSWNDSSTPWKERGVEDLAEVAVWGLQRLASERNTDPDLEKEAAFRLITDIDLAAERSVAHTNHWVGRLDPAEVDADLAERKD